MSAAILLCSVYAIEFKADDLTVYSGQHYLVNYGVPDFSPMAFIGGGGPFVGLWSVELPIANRRVTLWFEHCLDCCVV